MLTTSFRQKLAGTPEHPNNTHVQGWEHEYYDEEQVFICTQALVASLLHSGLDLCMFLRQQTTVSPEKHNKTHEQRGAHEYYDGEP